MNEKLNIQDLVDMLAEKHGMEKKDADSFVKEFFQLIEESLEKDRYVKIRGLGTFKLIDVGSREIANANTRERVKMQGYTKVSFTPEPILKDIINRPFSHFETVALNDATVLEDTLLENDSENDEDAESQNPEQEVEKKAELAVEETVIATDEVAVKEPMAEGGILAEEETEEILVETVIEELITDSEPEVEEESSEPSGPVAKDTADSSTMKYFISIVVFVVLLCGGAVAFVYYPDLLDKFTAKPLAEKVTAPDIKESVTEKSDVPADKDSTVSKDIVVPARTDTVAETVAVTTPALKESLKENVQPPSVPKKGQKKAAVPFEPDSVGYTIVGTETTYTIKEGETLTKVALRFYGTKALWLYIVKHNPGIIKNPDNVPYGTIIRIPKLAKKQ